MEFDIGVIPWSSAVVGKEAFWGRLVVAVAPNIRIIPIEADFVEASNTLYSVGDYPLRACCETVRFGSPVYRSARGDSKRWLTGPYTVIQSVLLPSKCLWGEVDERRINAPSSPSRTD